MSAPGAHRDRTVVLRLRLRRARPSRASGDTATATGDRTMPAAVTIRLVRLGSPGGIGWIGDSSLVMRVEAPRALGESIDGGLVRVQDLVALRGLRGHLSVRRRRPRSWPGHAPPGRPRLPGRRAAAPGHPRHHRARSPPPSRTPASPPAVPSRPTTPRPRTRRGLRRRPTPILVQDPATTPAPVVEHVRRLCETVLRSNDIDSLADFAADYDPRGPRWATSPPRSG